MPTQGYITEIGAEWEGTTPSTQLQLPIAAAKLRDKSNIDGIGFDGSSGIIHYATCTQAANVVAKSASVVDANGNALPFSLVKGSVVYVKFSNSNTAQNPTLNVNNTGAKPIKRYSTTAPSNTASTSWNAGSVVCLVYDGTYWQMSNWLNSTYANYSLGQGYGTCATPESTTAKIVTLSNYSLSTGGIVAVKFTNAVPANSTMDINSRGSKSIYHRGAPITSDIIKAGDTATFIYSTYYHLISLDHVGEYELPIATDTVLGGVKVGAGLSISSGGVLSANGGGVADAVAWGHITGTLADQTDLGTALGLKANTADLSDVAFSNDYEDLDNKPDIPTSTSELDNDSGFLTSADLPHPADSNPLMDGTVSIGSSTDYAREDHRHPTDTSRAADTAVVHKAGAEVITGEKTATADLILRNTTGSTGLSAATPNLVFQRGANTDSYIDWLVGANENGRLVVSSRSAGTETVRMQLIGSSSLHQLLSSIDIKAPKFITDGGTAQQYVKGDGTLGGNATQSAAGLLSATDKTKLDGIAAGAEVNVQSDWNQTDNSADDFIRNKPTITTYDVFQVGGDTTPPTAGIDGLVPAPLYTERLKFLRGDGTWQTPDSPTPLKLNGKTLYYPLFQKSLVVCTIAENGRDWFMSPICTSGGTGEKTPNFTARFAIGSTIYYHADNTTFPNGTAFSGKTFYSSYENVDARYFAVNGQNLELASESRSDVYMRVVVSNGYWWPYYKNGDSSEIIVTPKDFVTDNFYIYLGKTSSNNNYTFQLEENHPLYYFDGYQLVDYTTWNVGQLRKHGWNTFTIASVGNSNDFYSEYQISSEIYSARPGLYTDALFDMHATLRNTQNASVNVEVWLEVGYYDDGNYTTTSVLCSGQIYLQRGSDVSPVISTINLTGSTQLSPSYTTNIRVHFKSTGIIDLLASTTNAKPNASLIRLSYYKPI